ncbi:C2H2-type domain-containing protein, partial [Haematococcus lacustris]
MRGQGLQAAACRPEISLFSTVVVKVVAWSAGSSGYTGLHSDGGDSVEPPLSDEQAPHQREWRRPMCQIVHTMHSCDQGLVQGAAARLLYHEAAVLEGQQSGGKARLQLLQEALACASIGTQLNPNSLSTAALRATLCVNMLVELSGSAAGAIPDALSIKEEFKGAILACQIAASTPEPTLSEPVIAINDGSQTCDPCSLRVQDQVLQWVKEGRWDRVVQEKRNVLVCMQQVLHSCYTLLDSSQIPVDGVVRLLQHILRVRPFNTMPCRTLLPQKPVQQQDLQVWAGQLLGKGTSLDEFQKKFEAQAAVSELLKLLRPGASGTPSSALGLLPDAQLLLQAQQNLLSSPQADDACHSQPAVDCAASPAAQSS